MSWVTSKLKNIFVSPFNNAYEALFGDSGGIFTNYQGAWDKFKNGQTNAVNAQIAQQNIDYQNAYNEQIFNREDTAMQRGVADARAAGLSALQASPLTSGGTASAPQNNMQYQDRGDLGAIGDIFSTISSVFGQKASIDHLNAETDSINMDNKLKSLTFNERLSDLMNTFSKNQLDFLNTRNRYNYEQANGFAPGMSFDERMMTMIANTFGIPTFSLGEKVGDFHATDYSSIGDSLKNVVSQSLQNGDSSQKQKGKIERMVSDVISGLTGSEKAGNIAGSLFVNPWFNPSYAVSKGAYNLLSRPFKSAERRHNENNTVHYDDKGKAYYKGRDGRKIYLVR